MWLCWSQTLSPWAEGTHPLADVVANASLVRQVHGHDLRALLHTIEEVRIVAIQRVRDTGVDVARSVRECCVSPRRPQKHEEYEDVHDTNQKVGGELRHVNPPLFLPTTICR